MTATTLAAEKPAAYRKAAARLSRKTPLKARATATRWSRSEKTV
jgi:hypothetical protein